MSFPTSPRSALLLWAEAHAPVWTLNASAIGLSGSMASSYQAAVDGYSAASIAQEAAKEAYRVATEEAADAFGTLRSFTGDRVRTIRAFAENAPKPLTVYNLAQIPPPAQPPPAPPPAQPTDLRVELDPATGELMLRWKAANPVGTSGTTYVIKRRLPGEPEFEFINVSGLKRYTDASLLAGPDFVQYTIQGQRAGVPGPVSAVFTVNFGRLPEGGTVATVTTDAKAKAA